MQRRPGELDYRPAEEDRAERRGHYVGAIALAAAVVAWGWVALGFSQSRWRLPWPLGENVYLWAALSSAVAVVLGIAATRQGRPLADSRLGNTGLILAGSLWLTLVAMLASRR